MVNKRFAGTSINIKNPEFQVVQSRNWVGQRTESGTVLT